MPNWRPITFDDLTAASVSNKVTLIRNAASARSLPDPAPAAITKVTAEVVAAIGFSGKYVVDQDETAVPNGLLDLAIGRIVRQMAKAVNLPLSQDERDDDKTYESRLDKIRHGDWPIENADNPVVTSVVQTSVTMPATKCRPRAFTRRNAY